MFCFVLEAVACHVMDVGLLSGYFVQSDFDLFICCTKKDPTHTFATSLTACHGHTLFVQPWMTEAVLPSNPNGCSCTKCLHLSPCTIFQSPSQF